MTPTIPQVAPPKDLSDKEIGCIAEEVAASRRRVQGTDPGAYGGYVTDAACRAVAERKGLRAVDVLRAYRVHYPNPNGKAFQPFPIGARHPSDEVKALA